MASVSVLSIASLLILFAVADARIPGIYTGGQWENAHATFYGGNDASGTMGTLSILSTFLAGLTIPIFQVPRFLVQLWRYTPLQKYHVPQLIMSVYEKPLFEPALVFFIYSLMKHAK
jgi:hypothetical protein